MPTDTTEAALEACIERFLTGDVSTPTSNDGKVQSRARGTAIYQAGKGVGFLRGQSSDFNADFALNESKFWQFLSAFRRRLRNPIRQTVSVIFSPLAA